MTNAKASQAKTLSQVKVSAPRFLDADTSGITNVHLPIQQVPQSITLINNDFVKAADLQNMGEIAQYTTGAMWSSYSPSYGNQVWLRGFAANWAIDGLIVGDQITEPDPATLERYEVVKGPASVVYGAQSPGGVINLVSKSAAPGTPSYVQVTGGSWGRRRVEAQAAGALNQSGSVRGIVVVADEKGGSPIHSVNLSKKVIYGGLDVDFSPTVHGYIRASYQRTEDTPFNGIPTYPNGTLVPVSRSFYIGGSDFAAVARAARVDTGLTWTPNDLWEIDLKALYQHTRHSGSNLYNYDYIDYNGSFPTGGEKFNNWHVDDFSVAATATRKLDDLDMSGSSISASLRYQYYRYYINEDLLSGGIANIFDGQQAVENVFNTTMVPSGTYEQDETMQYLTFSTQGLFKLADPLTAVVGLAYSQPKIQNEVDGGQTQNLDPGHQLDYRGALIYQLTPDLNVYAQYSESFQPNLRLDTSFQVLPPVQGKQYEVGTKYVPTRNLLLTAAVFDIHENNVAIFDSSVGGEALYRSSDVHHRGVELDATGQLAPGWQVKGGFSWLDATITRDPENPINNGETQPWIPRQTASLFTSYDFSNGIFVSGGARYEGAVKTYNTSSPYPTPALHSYVVVDAGVGYTFDRWLVQLNLKNALDERYYVSTPLFQSLSAGLYPGEPRSLDLSVRMDF